MNASSRRWVSGMVGWIIVIIAVFYFWNNPWRKTLIIGDTSIKTQDILSVAGKNGEQYGALQPGNYLIKEIVAESGEIKGVSVQPLARSGHPAEPMFIGVNQLLQDWNRIGCSITKRGTPEYAALRPGG